MRKEEFCEVLGDISEAYVKEARADRSARRPSWQKWGAIAACFCLLVVGGVMLSQRGGQAAPDPDMVQIPNPVISVASVEEMETYLDFDVPVLDKEVESYSVLVEDQYPVMGQIHYADGSEFRMQYGSGDISGIHGGTLEESENVGGVNVEYYKYENTVYAIWEQNGFTFSYVYAGSENSDVESIIQQFE